MSISSSLQSIYDSKQAIKASLINKGQSPTDVLSTYSSLIDAIELGSILLNKLDTSEMVSMAKLFHGFNGVSTIDISGWDMTKVINMDEMFRECDADYLVLGDLMPTALTSARNMFSASKFKALDLHNLPIGNIKVLSEFFSNCQELESVDLTGWNTSNVTNMSYLFYGCSKLTSIDLSSFDTSNVTSINSLFYGCRNLTSIDLSSFDTSNVISMNSLFLNCSALTSIDLSSFDTSNVTSVNSLFLNCTKLTSIDLSSFDTSNVTNMSYLFAGCSVLTSVDLSSFDTSNVISMSYLFYACRNLTSIDLSSFDTSNVTNMSYLFYSNALLTSVTGFSMDSNNNIGLSADGVFYGCSRLTSLLFKSGGTMCGRLTNSSQFILDLSQCIALTEASVVAMINSCSTNTSGYVRGFKLASSVYSLLTEDDIALFTEKNYTVSAGESNGLLLLGSTSG